MTERPTGTTIKELISLLKKAAALAHREEFDEVLLTIEGICEYAAIFLKSLPNDEAMLSKIADAIENEEKLLGRHIKPYLAASIALKTITER